MTDGSIPVNAVFGDALKLNAYSFAQGKVLELEWQVLREISADWRAFAIVLDRPFQAGAEFEVILQQDATAPVMLDFLRVDETCLTRHEFELPPGYRRRHGIDVGWYNEDLNMRLEAPYPANMLLLENQTFGA